MLLSGLEVSFLVTLNRKLETFMHMGFVILNCRKNVNINNNIALINHFQFQVHRN